MRGNHDAAFSTDTHAFNTNVPSFDDLAGSEFEGKRLSLFVGYAVVRRGTYKRLVSYRQTAFRP